MRAEILFLHRFEEISLLVESHEEIDLLDLAGRLYQMIGDKHALMDSANVRGLSLRFRAADQPPPPDWILDISVVFSFEDSVDPAQVEGTPQGEFVREMTKDEFLKLSLLWLNKAPLTIRHIIGYARNVAGGTHHDPTQQHREYAALAEARDFVSVGGSPLGVRQLRAIGRVVVRALQPLYDDIKKHGAEP
ncbi:hypothetical protein [Phenylobacterium sp.]|uniref:hypothetical protein n=1 Tax=Phenylobacterium sp. TaxID=1871053 RepID=UPI002718B8A8|nr:hypothetical protein [Phenylobacterium sp.]MDO8379762.1 hypothetical protein [Phenylobacterium sp.]